MISNQILLHKISKIPVGFSHIGKNTAKNNTGKQRAGKPGYFSRSAFPVPWGRMAGCCPMQRERPQLSGFPHLNDTSFSCLYMLFKVCYKSMCRMRDLCGFEHLKIGMSERIILPESSVFRTVSIFGNRRSAPPVLPNPPAAILCKNAQGTADRTGA